MKIRLAFALLLSGSLYVDFGMAQATAEPIDPGPKFGPEFTFFNPDRHIGAMHDPYVVTSKLVERIKAFEIFGLEKTPASPRTFRSSVRPWSIQVDNDKGVIEVTTTPMTVEEFEANKTNLEDAIFGTTRILGLIPAMFLGGGHISIDYDYLYRRPLLMRNFLADLFINHVELFMGVFGYDTLNALPQILSSVTTINTIKDIFDRYDTCTYSTLECLDLLVARLGKIAIEQPDPYINNWTNRPQSPAATRPDKYLAVNLQHLKRADMRIELRAVRPQLSIEMWIRQTRLLRNRLRYLQTLAAPVEVKMPFALTHAYTKEQMATDAMALNPPVRAMAALQNFKKFVEESGEKIEDHLDYVWPKWQTDGSVAEFKRQHGVASCRALLYPRGHQ